MEIYLNRLKAAIEKMSDIPGKEWAYFSEQLHERTYNKGKILIQEEEHVENFFFIVKGLVRSFCLTPEGKEFNKSFAREDEFVGSIVSKVLKEPSRHSSQALEKTTVLVLPLRLLEENLYRSPVWERIARKQAERVAIKKDLRESELLTDSAEKRYRRFLEEFPELVNRIPLYHIASYLGITDVALSRIRKKIQIS